MSRPESITRRGFLKATSSAVASVGLASVLRTRSAAAADRVIGANDRITIGVIGSGGRGTAVMGMCMNEPNIHIKTVCDLAEFRIRGAIGASSKQTGGPAGGLFGDYRPLLDDRDIDAVIIATPDHWHFQPYLDALGAGKHIYQEKPMCFTIEQGLEMIRASKARPKQIVQIGTHRRSYKEYGPAREFITQGKLGNITFVRCWDTRNWSRNDPFAPHPYEGKVDWDRFQEPCKHKVKYDDKRYFAWRWYWDYAGGLVTDVGVHVMDVVHLLTGADTPKTAVANGGVYGLKYWETPDVVNCVWDYGTHSVAFTGNFNNGYHGDGLAIFGTDATMIEERGKLAVYSERDDHKLIQEFERDHESHPGNWLRSIRGEAKPHAPAELGFQSLLPSLIANLAYRSGRKLSWDAAAQKVVGL